MKSTYFETLSDKFYFGQFSGESLGEVMSIDPNYVKWVAANVDCDICCFSKEVLDEMKLIFPNILRDNTFIENIKRKLEEYYNEEPDEEYDLCEEEPDTYDRYNGSYAQDVMGYSDDEIDIVFDGDPDAYWNID